MLNVILISGASGVGKTSLLLELGSQAMSRRIHLIDTDSYRVYLNEISKKFGAPQLPPEFHLSANISTDMFEKKAKSIQEYIIEPALVGASRWKINACVIAGHILPGHFDTNRFPQMNFKEVLIVCSDKETHRNRLRDRKPKFIKYFEQIRQIQQQLILHAQKSGIQIIESNENTLDAILELL